MAQLDWNNVQGRYEAELSDGSLLVVDGDEFGKAHAERAAFLSGVKDANECLPEDAEQAYEDTLEVSQWEALVGVNPGVRVTKK